MTDNDLFIGDMTAPLPDIPEKSIISQTFIDNDTLKGVLFGFAVGQELSEHTASMPAALYFVSGEAHVTLGSKEIDAKPGTWLYMPASLPHSIKAKTPVTMQLLLFKP